MTLKRDAAVSSCNNLFRVVWLRGSFIWSVGWEIIAIIPYTDFIISCFVCRRYFETFAGVVAEVGWAGWRSGDVGYSKIYSGTKFDEK
jgi:hypothetical protein